MATMEARPEAKPKPKEIEESYEPLLKYKATEGARMFGAPMSIGVDSVDLKPKRFDEAKENTDTSTNVEDPDKTNCR
ncbi:hypothetical protein ACFX2F_033355 [Malus domestica]